MDIVKKQEADILEARTAERLQKSKTQKSKLLSNIDNLLDTEKPETKQLEDDYLDYEEEFTPYIPTIFDILDRPRILPDPVDLTLEHLKEIENKLGLIRLCWPKLDKDVIFEERTNFPKSYLENNSKDRCLLLYAENFRRQYCFKYPHRKPLLLACDNECGMQKMVCTTIRPTKLPYHEVKTWQKCAEFISNLLKYEPLEKPTNLFMMYFKCDKFSQTFC